MPRRAAILSATLPALALAACADHRPVERRALNAARRAVDRTTWQGEAKITDPTQECTYYDYAPVNNIVNTYPEIWETATLSSAGIPDEPKQLFASINQSIPNIAPRGDREGNFQGVSYGMSRFLHGTTDPDCWWSYTRCDKPKMKGLNADITRCPEPNTWGFTLDDGPNCTHNAYYDYLQTIDQKATLFYIGSNVLDWPLEAQRGLADGHEICAHTWSHPYMTSMTNEEAFAELYFSKKAIFDILGVTVRCWRPPYGDVDDRIRFIAQALDMRTVVWNEDTDDYNWVTLGMNAIRKNYQGILNKQTAGKYNASGVIVLSHELNNGTMALSEEFLPQIRKQFTGGVVPVAVCLNNTQPYAETSAYTYPNYAQYVAGTHSISLAAPTAAGAASETLATASGSYGAQTGAPASASSTGTSSSMLTQVASAASAQSSTSASGATAVAQHNTSGATSLSTLGGLAAMVAGALAGAAALA